MAKLIVVCLAAAWLTVALPSCSASPTEVTQKIASIGYWMGQVERKEEKSTNDWAALEKGYHTILYSKSFTVLSANELYRILVKVKEAHEHLKDQKLAINSEVVETLLSRRRNMDCEDDSSILKTIKDYDGFWKYPPLFKYLTDSVSRHLEHCKYEEMFEQAIRALGQVEGKLWDWIKYPTLYDYWKINVRPLIRKKKGHGEREMIWLVRLVKKMTDIDCNVKDFANSFVTDLIKSKLYHPELYALVDNYFMKYLRDCGFEDRFEKIMGECSAQQGNQHEDNKVTFQETIKGQDYRDLNEENKGEFEGRMKLAIEVMSRLVAPSQIRAKSHCNKDFTVRLRDDFHEIEKAKYSSLHSCMRKILYKHLDVCQATFIAKGEEFKRDQQHNWNRVKMFAAAMKGLSPGDKELGVNAFEIMLREGSWKDGKHGLTVADSEDDVEQPCEAFLDEMESSIDALDYEEIKDKTSVMEFYVPFEFCAMLLKKETRLKEFRDAKLN